MANRVIKSFTEREKMFKKYSAWISILSFVVISILAICYKRNPFTSEKLFVMTEIVLTVLFFVAGIIAMRKDK